ncbi:MAG: DUF4374 domain-containing protein [Mucilaginibacter polytrichastri]|nr:DUF4374 domain-containing protein [Mucilaginibacter polytrichastri]
MNRQLFFGLVMSTAVLASCSKSSDSSNGPGGQTPGNYILTVTPAASTGVADYLLTTESLETGSVSTAGNGIEQDGTYRYYVTTNNKFFSMLYGQGNPGAVTAYNIQDGRLNKLTNFQTETVQAFAPVNDDLLLFKISRSLTAPTSTWYKVNTNSLLITSEGTTNTMDMTGNGELGHFSWITQVGSKVYAPYFTINSRAWGTAYPDSAFVAVFNYADMKLEKVIRHGRSSFIGRYFTNGLAVLEDNYVYAFSSSVATDGTNISSKLPSAVTRINATTHEFDNDYYFDFEAVSGGMNITDWQYIGNNLFVVNATTKAEKGAYATGNHIGIVNVAAKTFKAVTGMPAAAEIESLTANNYTPKDGNTGYIGVNLKDGSGWVYKIDAAASTATRGLKVEGGTITAIQFLAQ